MVACAAVRFSDFVVVHSLFIVVPIVCQVLIVFGPCFTIYVVLSVHPCIAIISLGKRVSERKRERDGHSTLVAFLMTSGCYISMRGFSGGVGAGGGGQGVQTPP